MCIMPHQRTLQRASAACVLQYATLVLVLPGMYALYAELGVWQKYTYICLRDLLACLPVCRVVCLLGCSSVRRSGRPAVWLAGCLSVCLSVSTNQQSALVCSWTHGTYVLTELDRARMAVQAVVWCMSAAELYLSATCPLMSR